MKIEGDDFYRIIQVELDKYECEVGILQDKPHYNAGIGFKTYAGQQLARTGRKIVGSLADVAQDLDRRFHWLERPWRMQSNQAVQDVVNDIAESMNGRDPRAKQRVLNGVQAVVRNPILRGDYGGNSSQWAQVKGFNKLLMWTGQFFQNIKARYVS